LSRQDYREALFHEDYRDLRGRIVSQLENIVSELEDEDEQVA
jgi:chemotaxis regulatin CheY-phosphate phosphatase CheZ